MIKIETVNRSFKLINRNYIMKFLKKFPILLALYKKDRYDLVLFKKWKA